MSKNILITGASGFIGGALLNFLSPCDLNLIGISRKKCENKNLIVADFTDEKSVLPILKSVDVVIHCAAITDNQGTILNCENINVEGTINLAKQAIKSNVKRFIFISSAKVNGESTSNYRPFLFSDNPSPKGIYATSKYEAEMALTALGKKSGMEIVIIRPPVVYGEGGKGNFTNLISLVKKGLPLPFCLINNKRSLVSVYNLVDLIKVCIYHPGASNQVFLVSDDHDLSTNEMVNLVKKSYGGNNLNFPIPKWCFKVIGGILRKNDMVERLIGSLQLDIEHTKNTLGWIPPYSIENSFKLSIHN